MRVKVVKAAKKSYWYYEHIGKVFEVVEVNKYDSKYQVVGEEKYFVKDDVEVVDDEQPEYPFFVRCIDAEQSDGYLEFGEIYKAIGGCYGSDHFLDGVHSTWSKDRFEIVEEDVQHPSLEEQNAEPRNKYMREVKHGVFCDVYDILRAWEVTDPCLQHLIKKALQPGKRHHKDLCEDLQDILSSAKRAVEMHEEWHK